jgi:hypothetical protein
MITPLLIILLVAMQITLLVILRECIHRAQQRPVTGHCAQARKPLNPLDPLRPPTRAKHFARQ